FRGASQQTGFVERLVSLFSELRNGKIDPIDLFELKDTAEQKDKEKNNDFARKMDDLSLLYSKYDEALKGKYVEREDLFQELIKYFEANRKRLKYTTIIIDKYEQLSAQKQQHVLNI